MIKLRIFERRPWLRDLIIVVVAVAALRAYQQRDLPLGAAPPIEALALDGSAASLASYRGKPVLLHFWATWCGVCGLEQSSIDSIATTYAVLSIASKSGASTQVAEHVNSRGIKQRVVVDTAGELAQRFGIHAFPTTFILDSDGQIRFREVGYTTELGLRARLWLAGSGR